MTTLEDAIALAAYAHRGQLDKVGQPYILHPIRVMLKMTSKNRRIIAILHDVIEDCSVSFEDLKSWGYDDAVITALRFVTKLPSEKDDYEAFIQRILTGPIDAILVKIADIEDNLDPTRILGPTQRDYQRWEKYRKALTLLKGE